MHKRILAVVLIAATTTLAAQQAPPASTPRELFERARMVEESNQKLTDAIVLYEQAAALAAKSGHRDLAATAHLRIGLIHERLGQKADAERAFRTVVTQYSEQGDVARQAQARLGATTSAPGAPSTRQVWTGVPIGPYGAPSPDGRLLSFVDWETGNLAVRDLTGGAIKAVTTAAPWMTGFAAFSVFSTDSRQIAFGWQKFPAPGSSMASSYELRTVGADGSNLRTVYSQAEVSSIHPFAWTPDGKQILAAFSNNDQTTQLALVAVETGRAQVLKSLDWRGVVKASLSPDGTWIAYDFPPREDSPAREIFLLAADGSRQIKLVEHPANDLFPMWTPDGKHVVFLSDRSGTVAAWIQDVSAGKPAGSARLLKADMTQAFPLGFTARGALYTMQPSPRDIYVASIDPITGAVSQAPARISEHLVGANSRPDWSADGQQVAWLSERVGPASSARMLCILSVATGQVRELRPALTSLDRPRWSPDGRSILVAAQRNGRYGLFKIDATTGDLTRVVELAPSAYFNGNAWSRDGSAVFYVPVGPTSDAQHVVRLDLASGRNRIIDESPGPKSDLALSHDGKWLAYRASKSGAGSGPAATIIRIAAVDGGPVRDVPPTGVPLASFRGINWTLDDQFLIFATANPKDRRYSLARIAATGGAPERIAPGFSDKRLMDARLHPDGRRLVFESGEDIDEIWVMENFLPTAPAKAVNRRVPLGLDMYMPVPEENPLTAARVRLGRALFFERRLSRDESLSCATCHDSAKAFTDGRPISRGVYGRAGRRNVPALVNRGYGSAFFWDGRAASLEQQVVGPIENPTELGSSIDDVVARLARDRGYASQFRDVFGRDVAGQDIARALAGYVRSILVGDSPVDRYLAGDRTALTAAAAAGLRLFRSTANCTACHLGPTFSDERFHNTGVAWRNGAFDDRGRGAVTGSALDDGAFKTPTLREVARTAPYMHDGSLARLEDVIDFYDSGGRPNLRLDAEIRPLRLTAVEKSSLVAFLRSLNGTVIEGASSLTSRSPSR